MKKKKPSLGRCFKRKAAHVHKKGKGKGKPSAAASASAIGVSRGRNRKSRSLWTSSSSKKVVDRGKVQKVARQRELFLARTKKSVTAGKTKKKNKFADVVAATGGSCKTVINPNFSLAAPAFSLSENKGLQAQETVETDLRSQNVQQFDSQFADDARVRALHEKVMKRAAKSSHNSFEALEDQDDYEREDFTLTKASFTIIPEKKKAVENSSFIMAAPSFTLTPSTSVPINSTETVAEPQIKFGKDTIGPSELFLALCENGSDDDDI
eukprot:g4173.t1